MADKTPNYVFERMKLVRQQKQIELNMFDCELRLVEIEGEKQRLQTNIEASKIAIIELEDRIAGIIGTAGYGNNEEKS